MSDAVKHRHPAATVARVVGAVALLAVGIEHIDQYYADSYSVIPVIGTLFVLNFAGAVVLTAGLLAPLRRTAGRWADALYAMFSVGGIALAAGSLAGLFISESSGLFGFRELGYRPVIVLSIVLETATVVALALFVAFNGLGVARRDGRLVAA